MTDSIRVTYLEHSGFIVETAHSMLVFDYYRDPAHAAAALRSTPKKIYVFASHAHGDHFNPAIAAWQQQAAAYILGSDIEEAGGLTGVPAAKIHYLAPYCELVEADLRVHAYGSTDAGVSFAVAADGWQIFYAGDLNWWHWQEDTPENIALAKHDFFRELARLQGQRFDVAFFPVDSRLGEYRELGVRELVKAVQVGHLVAMHACGQPWTPPADFVHCCRTVWCPGKPGETRQLEK